MKNSRDSNDFVNVSLDQVMEWGEEMTKKGLYDGTNGRLLRTALRAIVSILGEDEPRDPLSVRENLDEIAGRWARANQANPSTLRSYRQRAAALLDDYVGYMRDPASFKGRGRSTGGNTKRTSKKASPSTATSPSSVGGNGADPIALNAFRLPDGRVVRYELPENFSIEDLRRFVFHLLPTTIDFDPMKPSGGMIAMAPGLVQGAPAA